MAKLGIYCIENWSGRLANRDSVRPVLEVLETSGAARYIHQRVSTIDQLQHFIADWAPRKQQPVCYLALHGSPQGVWVGRDELSLESLLQVGQGDGERPMTLKGKTLYLASCSTLAAKRPWLRKVRRDTGLNTLCATGAMSSGSSLRRSTCCCCPRSRGTAGQATRSSICGASTLSLRSG